MLVGLDWVTELIELLQSNFFCFVLILTERRKSIIGTHWFCSREFDQPKSIAITFCFVFVLVINPPVFYSRSIWPWEPIKLVQTMNKSLGFLLCKLPSKFSSKHADHSYLGITLKICHLTGRNWIVSAGSLLAVSQSAALMQLQCISIQWMNLKWNISWK